MSTRTTYSNFESALATFDWPAANLEAIREFVAGIDYEEVYIPASRSYIALVPRGGGLIATVEYGFLGFRDVDGKKAWKPLPINQGRDGNGVAGDRPRNVCPVCGFLLPATGVCDNTDFGH